MCLLSCLRLWLILLSIVIVIDVVSVSVLVVITFAIFVVVVTIVIVVVVLDVVDPYQCQSCYPSFWLKALLAIHKRNKHLPRTKNTIPEIHLAALSLGRG